MAKNYHKKAKEQKRERSSGTISTASTIVKKEHISFQLLWLFVILLLFIPILSFKNKAEKLLNGEIAKSIKPKFIVGTWFNGDYQKQYEEYVKDNWPFKEKLTRFNNQLDYSLFNKIHVDGFISGKEQYVFSKAYIQAAMGQDYSGDSIIAEKVRKIKTIQDTLKKKNIDLVIVYAPGKGSFYPEYIPDQYKVSNGKTNIADFLQQSKLKGINYLDLHTYFMNIKNTSKYPLFPQYGHHWSYYGECVAADTIIKYIEALRKTDLPDFYWNDVEVSDTCRSRDDDVVKSMNLIYKPSTFKMAYPKISFEENLQKNQTKVLSIADSYYWGIVYMGILQKAFGNGGFWYYNNKVYPRVSQKNMEVWELDLKQSIEQYNVILLFAADGNLPTLGWGFIEDAYLLYTNPPKYYQYKKEKDRMSMYKKQIHEDSGILNQVKKIAEEKRISLDSAINTEARRMMALEPKNN